MSVFVDVDTCLCGYICVHVCVHVCGSWNPAFGDDPQVLSCSMKESLIFL